ncbi:DUF4118 domain-containing protein [Methylomonas sp. 2BW1-5-20]|uniref:DUF4118 domain-containing protein n=1 Tax=Methylomonas sp. 2BW1-5-20 TaxID=3376686 RepID=UPI00404D2D47
MSRAGRPDYDLPTQARSFYLRRRKTANLFAVLFPVLAPTVLSLLPQPFGNCPLIMLFLFPVIVSAWLGGLGPGLRATGMSAIVFCYFMLAPFHGLVVATESGALEWILLIFCSLSISLMSEFMLYLRQRRHRLLGGEDGLRQKAKACSGIGPWRGGKRT